MILLKRLMLAFILLSVFPVASIAQEVLVTIKNVRNTKGNIRVGIFKNDETFQDKNADRIILYKKDNLKNGVLTVRIKLEPGVYGLSLLDDENSNNKMDFNLIHIPKEGFGFSDYVHSGLSMPHFEDFDFSVKDNATTSVTVKMKYM